MFRKPDWPTLMTCTALIVGAFIVYHVCFGRKKGQQ